MGVKIIYSVQNSGIQLSRSSAIVMGSHYALNKLDILIIFALKTYAHKKLSIPNFTAIRSPPIYLKNLVLLISRY